MEKLVVGVRFRESGKVYYFDPGDIELKKGDAVIVSTVNGDDFGTIVLEPRNIPKELVNEEIHPVVRKATDEDRERKAHLKELADEARKVFDSRVSQHDLSMKLIDVQYTFDEKKVVFFFTAEGRVDFRDLVKDLAGYFHARIELRQIGVRDEARKYAGIGVCGRKCCCASWLSDFVPVSIKMAKEQNLSLNSTKISGICGRLLCCLTYEEATYEELAKRMPNVGDQIKTPDGIGTVYKLRTLEEAVLVKILNDQDEMEIKRYTLEELDEAAKMPEVKVTPNKSTATPPSAQTNPRTKAYKEIVDEKRKEAEKSASESKRVNSRIRKPAGNRKKNKAKSKPEVVVKQKEKTATAPKKARKKSKRRPLNTSSQNKTRNKSQKRKNGSKRKFQSSQKSNRSQNRTK